MEKRVHDTGEDDVLISFQGEPRKGMSELSKSIMNNLKKENRKRSSS